MYLIGFPNRTEHRRAIMALLDVPGEYLAIAGPTFVLNDDQIQALDAAKVQFRYLSRPASNGKKATRRRS
jgi:hypothetical protein